MRRLFRRRRRQFVVMWWPDYGNLPLPDMPELIGPFRSNMTALAVRNSLRRQQQREEKMAHVQIMEPAHRGA